MCYKHREKQELYQYTKIGIFLGIAHFKHAVNFPLGAVLRCAYGQSIASLILRMASMSFYPDKPDMM